MNIAMAADFKFIIYNADGTIKTDLDWQKNMILDKGLDFFGGGNGTDMMAACVIGSGNSEPTATQNTLDAYVAGVNGKVSDVNTNAYTDDGSGLYKTSRTCTYRFTGLNNVNVSEVGLASVHSSSSSYYLCTRTNTKDTNGNPTTITIQTGEILDVVYRLWQVFSVSDTVGSIMVNDGVGGSVEYTTTARLAAVAEGRSHYGQSIGKVFSATSSFPESTGLLTLETAPKVITERTFPFLAQANTLSLSTYTQGSYKATLTGDFNLNTSNGNIKGYGVHTTMGHWQVGIAKTSDGTGLVKTNQDNLTIPVEISWARYSGVL